MAAVTVTGCADCPFNIRVDYGDDDACGHPAFANDTWQDDHYISLSSLERGGKRVMDFCPLLIEPVTVTLNRQ